MSLGKYIKVDSVRYPNPTSFKISFKNNENVNLSEAYTELVSTNRLLKLSADMTYQVTSHWKDIILGHCSMPFTIVWIGERQYSGRLRCSSCELAQHSENTSGTDGLWKMKVTFTER